MKLVWIWIIWQSLLISSLRLSLRESPIFLQLAHPTIMEKETCKHKIVYKLYHIFATTEIDEISKVLKIHELYPAKLQNPAKNALEECKKK